VHNALLMKQLSRTKNGWDLDHPRAIFRYF